MDIESIDQNWSDDEERHWADNDPPLEWEWARYAHEEDVPFEVPRD